MTELFPLAGSFLFFAESRSLSTMRGPLWDSIRGRGGGGGGGGGGSVTGCIYG